MKTILDKKRTLLNDPELDGFSLFYQAKKTSSKVYQLIIVALVAWMVVAGTAQAERIKDIASVAGVRSNQLIGYGLVVGLNGTGDGTAFTQQSLKNMLNKFGVNSNEVNSKNVAAVMVNAELPPFAKPGQELNITLSSIGDAKSLSGGTLLMTPLKGADDKVYAVAQGNLLIGRLSFDVRKRNPRNGEASVVARIPNGAIIERAVDTPFSKRGDIVFNLHSPDFTTAQTLAKSINNQLGEGTATPLDATSIQVTSPRRAGDKVAFLSLLENIKVNTASAAAKIIVNSRTGTVVISNFVKVKPAAVSHGSLVVAVGQDKKSMNGRGKVVHMDPEIGAIIKEIDQETTAEITLDDVNKNTELAAVQEQSTFMFEPGGSLRDIVDAINAVGADPSDLVSILDALKEVGALQAKLIVI